ncbi:MAG: hypothetical protein ACLRPV_10365 [Lacrimispora saccharolytica]
MAHTDDGLRFRFVIVRPISIGAFLVYQGSGTFTKFGHSLMEFLGSTAWDPADGADGGGTVGALIFIVGSLSTCGLALLISTPFAQELPRDLVSKRSLRNSEKNFIARWFRSLQVFLPSFTDGSA